MSSALNEFKFLGNNLAVQLGALLVGSDHDGNKTLAASTLGLAFTLVFLCWGGLRLLTVPTPTRLPRAGKDPGWFGLGLAEAKRDFKINGRKILNEGYRKVRLYSLFSPSPYIAADLL